MATGGAPSLQFLGKCLGTLEILDSQHFRTSVAVNLEYWELGNAYARFCEVCDSRQENCQCLPCWFGLKNNAIPGRQWDSKVAQAREFFWRGSWTCELVKPPDRVYSERASSGSCCKYGTAVLNAAPRA